MQHGSYQDGWVADATHVRQQVGDLYRVVDVGRAVGSFAPLVSMLLGGERNRADQDSRTPRVMLARINRHLTSFHFFGLIEP